MNEHETVQVNNPLKVMARNWYGHLTENRARKLDRLWRRFLNSLKPTQRDLFHD